MIGKSILEQHSHLSQEELYEAYKIFFGTLVSESRLKIINLLRHGKRNVSEIIMKIGTDQTSVSHDLARLKRCGFVVSEREGKFIYYKLNDKTIRPLMEMIEKHMSSYCIHILHGVKGNEKHDR